MADDQKMDREVRAALVVGLGRSGASAAALLTALEIETHVYDRNPDALYPADVEAFLGQPEIPDEAFAGVDLIVLSPGVPPGPVRARAAEVVPRAGITGELAFALHVAKAARPDTKVIAITGTNGKSTITALTGALVRARGQSVFVGGNLGPPLGQRVADIVHGRADAPDVLVLECSSFQLETLPATTRIDVAILCNATEDHVDRYASFDEYVQTKARIFAGVERDGLALIGEDPRLRSLVPQSVPTSVVGGDAAPRLIERNGEAILDLGIRRVRREALGLAGAHNSLNALFALAAVEHVNAWPNDPEAVLSAFEGLPHRMQLVGEHDGVRYYDDSKATNIASVVAGLMGFERPFVLIAGGRLKGDDPTPLRDVMAQPQARGVVGFGEGGDTIVELAPEGLPVARVDDLDTAVAAARQHVASGDAIVLSPGGSSYDQYANFVERGQHFARLVTP